MVSLWCFPRDSSRSLDAPTPVSRLQDCREDIRMRMLSLETEAQGRVFRVRQEPLNGSRAIRLLDRR
jgi:hypothetical protein